ncbi:MAG TPA: 2-oxo-4-hydroxy-4-carboxy-5-ureidoimidazoline decarboxylase [Burkholderiaceae bacterium]|nr:2-oxo-4-hydroxy-4-carboxy-5-ureidoimidazoline decarboxylase [Burkholderiaceae bacterium]
MTLAQLAALDRAAYMTAFGGLFEHSPWVAEAAWAQRPFASEAALHDAMMNAVRDAPQPQQIAFLNLHPELAGKEAQAGTMTDHSTFEQHGAGLNALGRDELLELQRLNAAYTERHGFPFIIAVLGHTKPQIFEALRTRTGRDTDTERQEALAQIAQITRRRLNALFAVS